MGLSPFGRTAPKPLDRPFVPHTLMPSHGSPVPLQKFQIALKLRLQTSSGPKKKEPKCYCLSKSPVNEPLPGSPTGPLWRELPVSRAFFYISFGFPNKQGLLTKLFYLSFIAPVQKRPLPVPNRAPKEKDAPFHLPSRI